MTTVTRPALLSAMAYMLQAAGVTLAELAQHMGQQPVLTVPVAPGEVDIDAVHRRPGPAPKPKLPPAEVLSDQALRVIELADRSEGATIADAGHMLSVDYSTAAHHCDRLARMHRLTKTKAPGEHAFRFFARPAHAEAYVEARKKEIAAAQAAAEQQRQEAERARQQRAAEAARAAQQKAAARDKRAAGLVVPRLAAPSPTVLPKKPQSTALQGPAVETEATRRIVDSTKRPNARWQAQQLEPDPRWPSFSSTPLGVNPDTGRAWA